MPGTRAGTRRPDSSASASPAHSGRCRSAPTRSTAAPAPAVRRCAGQTPSGCTYRRWPSCLCRAGRLPPPPARRKSPAPVPAQRRGGCFPRSTGEAPPRGRPRPPRCRPAPGHTGAGPASAPRSPPPAAGWAAVSAGTPGTAYPAWRTAARGLFLRWQTWPFPLSACFPLILPESAAGVKAGFCNFASGLLALSMV